jgi:hypothetical protein
MPSAGLQMLPLAFRAEVCWLAPVFGTAGGEERAGNDVPRFLLVQGLCDHVVSSEADRFCPQRRVGPFGHERER